VVARIFLQKVIPEIFPSEKWPKMAVLKLFIVVIPTGE
jgi:hypothetical protein